MNYTHTYLAVLLSALFAISMACSSSNKVQETAVSAEEIVVQELDSLSTKLDESINALKYETENVKKDLDNLLNDIEN